MHEVNILLRLLRSKVIAPEKKKETDFRGFKCGTRLEFIIYEGFRWTYGGGVAAVAQVVMAVIWNNDGGGRRPLRWSSDALFLLPSVALELPQRCGQRVNLISCITSTSKTTPGTSDSQSLGNSMVYLLRWCWAVGGCFSGLLRLISCLKLLVKTNGMRERAVVIENSSNKGLGMCSPVVAVKGGVMAVWWQQGG
ncbi:unnamed protein product [Lactuca saligna]|uniref:Uncharacterized protein n=1 Tax=Lactuca saligna TaxID=75948 RepID=A0AA35Y466_LACSI|nr:unnamed protein product [Lactuca saligna]